MTSTGPIKVGALMWPPCTDWASLRDTTAIATKGRESTTPPDMAVEQPWILLDSVAGGRLLLSGSPGRSAANTMTW